MKKNENTQRKIIAAVRAIIKTNGLAGLTMDQVCAVTGLQQSLINRYYGGLGGLLRAYIEERDFWSNSPEPELIDVPMGEQIKKVLTKNVTSFYNHCEMKAMLLNEISNGNKLVKNIIREETATDNSAYYDIVSTLLQAGTDHLILGGYGIDNCPDNLDRVGAEKELMQSITQIVEWTFGN